MFRLSGLKISQKLHGYIDFSSFGFDTFKIKGVELPVDLTVWGPMGIEVF